MLLWLTDWLAQFDPAFGVARYLTLRAILSVLTALGITMLIGPVLIRKLGVRQISQPIRDYNSDGHLSKSGTPTMGGALILVGIAASCLLWGDLTNRYLWVLACHAGPGWAGSMTGARSLKKIRKVCRLVGSTFGKR